MMKVTSNAGDLARRFDLAAKRLNQTNIKTIRGVTLAGQRFAREISPVKSGALYRGIERRAVHSRGNVVSGSIISSVPKSFPYQFWVNEDIKSVHLVKRMTRFGKFPTSKTRNSNLNYWTKLTAYRQTKHTGIPAYFDLTFKHLSEVLPVTMKAELIKTLKVVENK